MDKSEWIDQIRTVSTATSDYYIQESLHPNYWGELAVRSCVRQAWNGGTPRSGTCTTSGTRAAQRRAPDDTQLSTRTQGRLSPEALRSCVPKWAT